MAGPERVVVMRGYSFVGGSVGLAIRVALVGCVAVVALAGFAGRAWGLSYTAYVTVNAPGAVIPIATASNTPGALVPVGNVAAGLAITPDGKTAYVTSALDDDVTPLALARDVPASAIQVLGQPYNVAISPDGSTAYVTDGGYVTPITIATNTAGTPIDEAGGGAIAITPDGSTAYVANAYTGTVTPITLATRTVGSPIPVGEDPRAIAITPDGKYAYVANYGSVTPIAVATNSPGSAISVPKGAGDIAISPDGKTAYVTTSTGVTPLTVATDTLQNSIAVTGGAFHIAITPDGSSAYVTNFDLDTGIGMVTPISLATRTAGSSVTVSSGVDGYLNGIAIAPTLRRSTSTSISCSPLTVRVGTSTSCTVAVTDTDSGTPVAPTGTVGFATDGSENFAGTPCTLSGTGATAICQVTYTPTAVGSGQHTITASYDGDGTHTVSSQQTVVLVTGRATSTTVSCTPPSTLILQSTTCTATVTDTDVGTPISPTGSIAFATNKSGRLSPGSCTPAGSGASSSCQVVYMPTAVGNGQHTITASYPGDNVHAAGSGQTVLQVLPRATITTLSCQQSTLSVGQSTMCTATVTDTAPGTPNTPAGTVRVYGNKTDGFTGSPCTLSGRGATASCQVTYTPTALGDGQHTITASYSGGGTHSSSHGQTIITVTPPDTR